MADHLILSHNKSGLADCVDKDANGRMFIVSLGVAKYCQNISNCDKSMKLGMMVDIDLTIKFSPVAKMKYYFLTVFCMKIQDGRQGLYNKKSTMRIFIYVKEAKK